MTIKPIKTNDDYQTALKQIESLMTAKPNTPEGDMLEVLVTLVEVYEQQHHALPLPDPIEKLIDMSNTHKDIFADKGYASQEKEQALADKGLNPRVIGIYTSQRTQC